jgi:hypothetical protein
MSFFQLGGALIAADLRRHRAWQRQIGEGGHVRLLSGGAGAAGMAELFRWVFVAGTAFTVPALIALWAIEQAAARTRTRARAQAGCGGVN